MGPIAGALSDFKSLSEKVLTNEMTFSPISKIEGEKANKIFQDSLRYSTISTMSSGHCLCLRVQPCFARLASPSCLALVLTRIPVTPTSSPQPMDA